MLDIDIMKDIKVETSKKSVNPQNMVRTDFKEQKLEKFFFEVDKHQNEGAKSKPLDISLTEDEFQKNHKLFLKDVENLEEQIMNKTDSDIVMETEQGRYT